MWRIISMPDYQRENLIKCQLINIKPYQNANFSARQRLQVRHLATEVIAKNLQLGPSQNLEVKDLAHKAKLEVIEIR